MFVDATPRYILSDKVWEVLYWMHCDIIVDVGGGKYRGSHWGEAFHRAKDLPTGARATVDPALHHLLGAPRTSTAQCPLIMIPERWRLKMKGEWGHLHIDQSPLHHQVEAVVTQHAAEAGSRKKQKRL